MNFLNFTFVGIWLYAYFIVPFYIFTRIYFQLFSIYGNFYFEHKLIWNDKINPQKRNIYFGLFILSLVFSQIAKPLIGYNSNFELIPTSFIAILSQTMMIILLEYKIKDKRKYVSSSKLFFNAINLCKEEINTFKNRVFSIENDIIEKTKIFKFEIFSLKKELQYIEEEINKEFEVFFPFHNVNINHYKNLLESFVPSGNFVITEKQINSIINNKPLLKKVLCRYKTQKSKKGNKERLINELDQILFISKYSVSKSTCAKYFNQYFIVENCKEFSPQDFQFLDKKK